jgi:16S rRNA processing protein RimM
VRVEVLTDWPERLDPGADVWPDGADRPLRILRAETGGRAHVLYLEGVETREAAEALVGRYLEAPQRELEPGTFFWEDLIGLRVESPDGALVGELVEIFRAGANEVYRIVGPGGERLVPALRSAVTSIDLDAGIMVVPPDDAEEVR